jgi:AbrB family looped-hinge helix DNA binding protein
MEAMLDELGRIVIPKQVRDDFGLDAGAVLEIQERPDGILLKPVSTTLPLKVEDGILVYDGELLDDDLEGAIQRAREERMRKVAGLE